MPVPTDTFWNIRRLNKVFAASAVLLFLVLVWATVQDFFKEWREPQRQGRVWEAAMVQEKIKRDETPERKAQIKQLETEIQEKNEQIVTGDEELKRIDQQIKQLESDQAVLEFKHNNLKATVTVSETALQDAITAKDQNRQREIARELEGPRKQVADEAEQLSKMKADLEALKKQRGERTKEVDARKKELAKLSGDVDALKKKVAALDPEGIAALSDHIRRLPLMQFINPAERVQQVVLTDVYTEMPPMKVPTIDRCTTCHVNIQKKDFTEEKVLAYLEEQVATSRKYLFATADPNKPAAANAPTAERPGSMAAFEFWHMWGRQLLAPASYAKAVAPLKTIYAAVEKLPQTGEMPSAHNKWDATPATQPSADPVAQRDADATLMAIIERLYREPDNKAVAQGRSAALAYPDRLRTLLQTELPPNLFDQLEDRYRYYLVDQANAARKKEKLDPLDASPVFLAHPRLDLYVDMDSPHGFESVGCTSCHDGSGQETDFVLAAHVAQPIWVDEKSGEPVLPRQLINSPKQEHAPDLSSMLEAIYPKNALVPSLVSALHIHLDDHDSSDHEAAPAKANEQQMAPDHAPPTAYQDPITSRKGRAIPQGQFWAHKYEPASGTSFKDVYHYWDRPMLPPQYLEANCIRCHADAQDIKEFAPTVSEGRYLFTHLGCVNCHQMDSIPPYEERKVGTDLRHVNAKLSPEFINTWVWAPKAFRPSTKMPHFFMLENNSSDEELRRTRQEARAITEYLVQTATPLPIKYPISESLKGSAEGGKALFNSLGCMACHTNLNERGEEWITNDLVKRAGLSKPEAKAAFEKMTYNERQLYVDENLSTGTPDAPNKYPDGSPKPIFINHGPELSGIGTKLLTNRTPEQARSWLFDWVKDPRHYSEYTVMPRLRLDDQQAVDLVEYLLVQKRTTKSPQDEWKAGLAPVDAEKVRELVAFFLRSRFSANTAYDKAIDETEINALAVDAMTAPAIPEAEATARVAQMDLQTKQLVFLGKKLVGHYGCMSCHAINGTETISDPGTNLSDWGQKGIDKLDYAYLDEHKAHSLPEKTSIAMVNGLSAKAAELAHAPLLGHAAAPVEVAWPHVAHSRTAWITQKLKNTRIYDRGKVLLDPRPLRDGEAKPADGQTVLDRGGKPYDKLRMPTFYLNDEQVDAIVTFVISNRDRLVSERLLAKTVHPQAKQVAQGRAIAEKYNCVGCHQIELNVPAVQQYYKSDELTTKAPPSLRGEGNKIQHDWLFNFLKNVEPLRPLPVIRMPSFPLADEEATALAAYFSAASIEESQKLKKLLDPVLKFIANGRSATTQPAADSDEVWQWFRRPEFATAAEQLRRWALERKQINEIQLDPSKNKPEELGRNYRTMLFKAEFTHELYDSPYPFVDSPRPQISQERFKLGEQFFYEMQCLKCHVMGDPIAEGAAKQPTAPNLSLAQQRLQRRWVRHWVQEPAIIQVGTAMPPFFTGLPIFSLIGQPWPASQGSPPAEVQRVESKYGDTVEEQAELLLDFLYAAGMTNYTAVQPAAMEQTGQPPPTEGTAPVGAPPTATQPFAPGDPSTDSPAQPAEPPEEKRVVPPAPPAKQDAPKAEPKAAEQEKDDAPKVVAKAGAQFVSGKVVLVGTAPEPAVIDMGGVQECARQHSDDIYDDSVIVSENNELKYVVVSISAGLPDGANYDAPKEPAVLDQKGCMYQPHVLPMMIGQQFIVKNSDPFLHNVHSLAEQNPAFNKGQPNIDPGMKVEPPKTVETYKIKCDVHPWMGAYVSVFDHPYFDVTKDDGTFAIKNLPPGEYTLRAWHEKLGTQEQQITIEAGKPANVKLEFKAE